MNDSALNTSALCKNFGSLVVADNISIDLPKGGRYALIGPNGAGKTTLINLITGRLSPDSGSVHLDGEAITALPVHRRVKRGLSRTFQINTLFPNLVPLQAVTLAVCERRGLAGNWWQSVATQSEAVEEAHDILVSLGLEEDITRPTREMAYGQQRILEIALALASKPKVLLLDEPAAGVPGSESAALFAAIAKLPDDMSVLFIEHDMNIVFKFATQIIVLVGGKVLMQGTPDEIANDAQVREVYLGSAHHG